jgi:hypothetical protein
MLVSAAPYFSDMKVQNFIYGQAEGSTYVTELRGAGYEVLLGTQLSTSRAATRAFFNFVRERRIDVIHIHTEADYLRTALIARRALGMRGAVIRTVHSCFLASGKWRLSRQLQAQIAKSVVQVTVAPSPDVVAIERSTIGRECQLVYNWVDDRIFNIRAQRLAQRKPGSQTALILGNCGPVKAHELALRAVIDAGWNLIHLGDEGAASKVERDLLDHLEQTGRLIRRGVQLPDESLTEATVFLMPSHREGMPVALAEGLVAGIPAMVRDAPGLGWARSFADVQYIPDDVVDWISALKKFSHSRNQIQSPSALPIDLSAKRGAEEYTAIYQEALNHRTRNGT